MSYSLQVLDYSTSHFIK